MLAGLWSTCGGSMMQLMPRLPRQSCFYIRFLPSSYIARSGSSLADHAEPASSSSLIAPNLREPRGRAGL